MLKFGCTKDLCCNFFFAIVGDISTESARGHAT